MTIGGEGDQGARGKEKSSWGRCGKNWCNTSLKEGQLFRSKL